MKSEHRFESLQKNLRLLLKLNLESLDKYFITAECNPSLQNCQIVEKSN
jgi:hypothetical protein